MSAPIAPPTVGATWDKRSDHKMQRDALVDQLRKLDMQRDALRAAIADASLLCAELPWGTIGTPNEAIWVAAQQVKVNRRAARRAEEKSRFGVVPPGPWDEDLDRHGLGPILWDLGDGYRGRLNRNMNGGWNYYITIPRGHALNGKDYTHEAVPCRFTYAGPEEDGGWTFGDCHDAEGGATVPKVHYRAYLADNHFSGEPLPRRVYLPTLEPVPFLTAEAVQEEVRQIKTFLHAPAEAAAEEDAPPYDMVGDYKIAPPGHAGDYQGEDLEVAKPKRSWAQIAAGK